MAADYLIRADRVWDGIAASPLEIGFVAVEDGRIAAVGRVADLGSRFDAFASVDLPGATLLPGLINAHVHCVFSATMTPVEDFLRDQEEGMAAMQARASNNLALALAAGVTTVRDLGGPNEVVFTLRDAIADGRALGPRIIASGAPITSPAGHCHWFSHQCAGVESVQTAARSQLDAGADVLKIFATGGNLTPGTNPWAPQFTIGELEACVGVARSRGVTVASHAHAPEGIRRSAAAGATTIEHCMFETEDGVGFDPATAELMARNGVAFVPTPGVSIREHLRDPDLPRSPIVERLLTKRPFISAALQQLYEAGAPLVAGSDAGIPNRGFGDFPADLAVLADRDCFLDITPREALVSATSRSASVLGLRDVGVLAPGYIADLLAVDGDPLTDIDDLSRTRFVMAAGRIHGGALRPVAAGPEVR